CTGVSFFHGSNDGQKGMGLIMLILVGLVPGAFALNMETAPDATKGIIAQMQLVVTEVQPLAGATTVSQEEAQKILSEYVPATGPKASEKTFAAIVAEAKFIGEKLTTQTDIASIPKAERTSMRSDVYLLDESIAKIL